MNLILPDGNKFELDKSLSSENKKEVVESILSEWDWYFTKYKNRKTQVCLEILSNYLCHEKASSKVGDD